MKLAIALAGLLSFAACTLLPTPFGGLFAFDVVNRSSVTVIVSVASDTAAVMPGFEPGDTGTITIPLLNPRNGISVEIQGTGDRSCELLADEMYETPEPFTLFIDDGPAPGTVELGTDHGASLTPIPLPGNGLQGCGG